MIRYMYIFFFFFQAEDGIRDKLVTGVQTCALPIYHVRRGERDARQGRSGPDGPARRRDERVGPRGAHLRQVPCGSARYSGGGVRRHRRSEEHTSELQSLAYLVCRLLLEKKKTTAIG